jgi:phosphatidylglycerol---prolipoprotein diacylglyceryl transferase
LPLRRTLDVITPLLAVLAIGLAVSHLASGSAYGAPTRLPWAIYLWDDYRHPSQAYETIAAILMFVIVWRVDRSDLFPGFQFLLWVTLSAAARLFLEGFRGDSAIVLGGLRTAQLAALAVLLLGLWLMGRWARNSHTEPHEDTPITTS